MNKITPLSIKYIKTSPRGSYNWYGFIYTPIFNKSLREVEMIIEPEHCVLEYSIGSLYTDGQGYPFPDYTKQGINYYIKTGKIRFNTLWPRF